MGCDCTSKAVTDADRERVMRVYDIVDLRGVAEQTSGLASVIASAERHQQKSERALELGLGDELAALHSRAAERDFAQVERQCLALVAGIDERISRDDWSELAQAVDSAFADQGGPALLQESADRLRVEVFEMDGLSATNASTVVTLFDEALVRASEAGLDGAVRLLRERLEQAIAGRPTAQLSPPTERQLICIAAETALCGIALVACMFIPFCWCCMGYFILGLLALAIIACLALV
jgi:hypothetical protein